MSSNFHLSIVSHAAAIVLGIVATTAYLTVYPTNPQSLADYISAICAKSFRSASAGEAPYLAENVSAMTKMMVDMGIRPSGDVDTDFVAMMVPHHQGAIEMAQAEFGIAINRATPAHGPGNHRHSTARDQCHAVVAWPAPTAADRTIVRSNPARANDGLKSSKATRLVKEP